MSRTFFSNTLYIYMHAKSRQSDIYERRKPYFSGSMRGAHLNAATHPSAYESICIPIERSCEILLCLFYTDSMDHPRFPFV